MFKDNLTRKFNLDAGVNQVMTYGRNKVMRKAYHATERLGKQ